MQNTLIILAGLIIYWVDYKYKKTWGRRVRIRVMVRRIKKQEQKPELSGVTVWKGERTGSVYMNDPQMYLTGCLKNEMKK